MTMVEEVHDVEIVEDDFDPVEARRVLVEVNEALAGWIGSTVHLADVIYKASQASCWRVDDDYRAGVASGAIAPDAIRGQQSTWLGWKFNRSGRSAAHLADYGLLRAIIAADPALPALAEPEGAARPLGKLLRPKYLRSETPDVDAHHEAIRQAWRDMVDYAGGDVRQAIASMPKALKRSEFAPLKRLAKPTEADRRASRDRKVAGARRAFIRNGTALLSANEVEQFDEAIFELVEMRKRWKP